MDCFCLPLMSLDENCDLSCLGGSGAETLACVCNPIEMQGNGRCDVACLQEEYEWDWGECYEWS